MAADLDRRTLIKLLGGAAVAGLSGCAPTEGPRQHLIRIFGLSGEEEAWLNVLTEAEQRELSAAFADPVDHLSDRAIRLATRVIAPRSRMFAFVGYPRASNRRSVCDGLIRE